MPSCGALISMPRARSWSRARSRAAPSCARRRSPRRSSCEQLALDLLGLLGVILLRAREVLVDLGLDDLVAREDLRILLRWNSLLLLELVAPRASASVSRPATAVFDLIRSSASFASADARSAWPSRSCFSGSLGSNRTTTSPFLTSVPSGASHAIFIGPNVPPLRGVADRRRLDRAQVALGGHPAHELLLRHDVRRGRIAARPHRAAGTTSRRRRAPPSTTSDRERAQRGLHFAPGSTRDTRSPGASPDLTSIASRCAGRARASPRSTPPPVLRYATGPSAVTNTASAGTWTTCGELLGLDLAAEPHARAQRHRRLVERDHRASTTLLGSVFDFASTRLRDRLDRAA